MRKSNFKLEGQLSQDSDSGSGRVHPSKIKVTIVKC